MYRSDGTWSRAAIEEYDALGDTYTVQLTPCGRSKYFVEASELRALKAGAYDVGRRVALDCSLLEAGRRSGAARRGAVIAALVEEYDDESDSYTLVREDDGKRLYYVRDEIVPTPKDDVGEQRLPEGHERRRGRHR